jgi:hypothetical protein
MGESDIPHILFDIDGLNKISPYRHGVPPCNIGHLETIINVHPNAYGGISSRTTTFDRLYRNFENHYKVLGINIEPKQYYLPWIDFSKCRTQLVDNFINGLKNTKHVMVANNMVLSRQSANFDFNPVVSRLATRHKDIDIILTNRTDGIIQLSNVVYFNGIIDGCDLNEVAYLSKYCMAIIGRSSGPYTFSMIKENLMDANKTFVCFCEGEAVARWYSGMAANVYWSNKYDVDHVVTLVEKAISEHL